MKIKAPEKTEVERRPVAFKLSGGGRYPYTATVYYKVWWSDGSMTHEWGKSVTNLPGFAALSARGKAKQEAMKRVRGDLEPTMMALKILMDQVEDACLDLDGQLVGGAPKKD